VTADPGLPPNMSTPEQVTWADPPGGREAGSGERTPAPPEIEHPSAWAAASPVFERPTTQSPLALEQSTDVTPTWADWPAGAELVLWVVVCVPVLGAELDWEVVATVPGALPPPR
jgi:hypothetical protein